MALMVVTLGITAILLFSRTTAHLRFKILINVDKDNTYSI